MFWTVSFVCAGIEFGFLSMYCVGVIEIRENFVTFSRIEIAPTQYTRSNQILYQQKQNSQWKTTLSCVWYFLPFYALFETNIQTHKQNKQNCEYIAFIYKNVKWPMFSSASEWPSGLRLQTYGSGGPGSNPAGPLMKFLRIFFYNWRQKFSKSISGIVC